VNPDDLANLLQPVQEAGIDVMATAAATLLASVICNLCPAHQERMIALIVTEAWRFYEGALAEEQRIRAALVPDTSGRMH
jgi:hypothetical protein